MHRIKPISSALLVFIALVTGGLEARACELRLVGLANVNIAPPYDPFAAAGRAKTERLEVQHRGEACAFFVTFSAGSGGGGRRALEGPSAALDYEIYRTSHRADILKAMPGAARRNVLSGAFGQGQAKQGFDYHLYVPPGQMRSPGAYLDSVKVSVYEGDLNSFRLADSRMVKVRTRVPPVVDVSLIDGGGRRNLAGARSTLDFGVLTTGKTKHFQIEVKTNSGYDIVLESENRGVLRLTGTPQPSSVRYTLSLDGLPLDLGSAALLPFSTSKHSHRFTVTIGRVENALRGRYQDNLLVTVTAR